MASLICPAVIFTLSSVSKRSLTSFSTRSLTIISLYVLIICRFVLTSLTFAVSDCGSVTINWACELYFGVKMKNVTMPEMAKPANIEMRIVITCLRNVSKIFFKLIVSSIFSPLSYLFSRFI